MTTPEFTDADKARIRLEGWVACWQHRMACGGSDDRVPELSRRIVVLAISQAVPFLSADTADVFFAFAEPSNMCVADAVELLNAAATDLRIHH